MKGSQCYTMCLSANLIKVTVEKVFYGDVTVPVPTSEVTIVAEVLYTFVAWPRHLFKPIYSTVYQFNY